MHLCRLESQIDFLFQIALTDSVSSFRQRIREATFEEILAVVECVFNFEQFNPHSLATRHKLSKLVAQFRRAKQSFKFIIISNRKFIRRVLCTIILNLILSEFIISLQHGEMHASD